MRELSKEEIETTAGGNPAFVIVAYGVLRWAAGVTAGAIGTAVGWEMADGIWGNGLDDS